MEPQMTTTPVQPTATTTSNTLSILAIVFGAVAVLILPIVFGVAGIACGAVAVGKHERLGKLGLAIAIVGTVLGFVLGAVVYANR
jgi:hypothetical protein